MPCSSETETRLLWLLLAEFRAGLAVGDAAAVRAAREDIRAFTIHSPHASIRRRAAEAVADADRWLPVSPAGDATGGGLVMSSGGPGSAVVARLNGRVVAEGRDAERVLAAGMAALEAEISAS